MVPAPLDVLFVHESKHHEPTCPIYLLPMGVIGMANWLVDHGIRTEIVHRAIELRLDPTHDVVDAVQRSGAPLVAMDLHWHAAGRDVMHTAARIKERCPDVRVVVGGYTASSFTEEILRDWPQIDYVIRGDGEEAILALARHFTEGLPLEQVPNLARIVDGEYVVSALHHVNDGADLGRYTFCRFEVLRHWEYYCQQGVMEGVIRLENRRPGVFYCNAGRGCPYNCTFCGGSYDAQRFISGRKKVAYRPVEAMVRDLARMADYNLDTWYNTFQPSRTEEYWRELFAAIRDAGIRINAVQECLHIPSRAWIEDFARTFGPNSRIDYVIYSGNDTLRKYNKHNYFSNQQVLDSLEILAEYEVRTELCCLTGLPFEELTHFDEHFRFVDHVRRRFDNAFFNAEILAIEPRAIMNVDAEGHAVTSHATTFRDFYEQHAEAVFIGFTPGRYSARVAQVLAAYTRVAAGCVADRCLFVDAMAADPSQYTDTPVSQWRRHCDPCEHHERCFSHPLFAELERYEADPDEVRPLPPHAVGWIDDPRNAPPAAAPPARAKGSPFVILGAGDRAPASTAAPARRHGPPRPSWAQAGTDPSGSR